MAPKILTPEEEAARKLQQSKTGKSNVAKSKNHERRVAHMLQDWTGVEFRRRRVEGRESTVIERESTADVIPVKGSIIFSVEAKSGAGFSIDGILGNVPGNIFTVWWHQASYDASLLSKTFKTDFYPLMFFKPHPNWDWVAVSQMPFRNGIITPKPEAATAYEKCKQFNKDIWFPHMSFDIYEWHGMISHNISRTKKKANYIYHNMHLDPLYLCRWKDFAANVLPESIFKSTTIMDKPNLQ